MMAREVHAGESSLAAVALRELRPHVGSVEEMAERIEHQRADGYRVAASFEIETESESEAGDGDAAAVAGFRIRDSLAWGRFLYVDDLVTRESLRGRGHADAVMEWVEEAARREGCERLHLDSGVGPERADAHRFYFRHGLRITAYHFARELT